jgi:hypothetical protein
MKTNLITLDSRSHHRNGVCGSPFNVAVFTDTDGTKKLFVDFGEDNYAVLQIDKLAAGDIAFGSNSWRGDHYASSLRKLIAEDKEPPATSGPVLYVERKLP